MISISCVWLIFTIIFFGLSVFHFINAGKKVAELNEITMASGKIEMLGLDIRKFVNGVNSFVANYNKSTSNQNLFAGFGYLLAGLVAIFSIVLELISKT